MASAFLDGTGSSRVSFSLCFSGRASCIRFPGRDNRFIQPDQAVTLQDRLQESGISFELLQPVGGNDAAQEVLTTAEENQADLIVIGLRKRSAVGKMILGSTAQRILLQATCDVLAVKVRQD